MRDSIDEDPLESDQDSTDEPDLKACPYCGEMISEMAEVCPVCKSYIVDRDAASSRQPRAVIITAILLMIIFALGYLVLR